jgi:hypothetical protein
VAARGAASAATASAARASGVDAPAFPAPAPPPPPPLATTIAIVAATATPAPTPRTSPVRFFGAAVGIGSPLAWPIVVDAAWTGVAPRLGTGVGMCAWTVGACGAAATTGTDVDDCDASSAPISCASASADAGRSSARFAINRRISRSTSGGRSGAS